MEATRSSGTSLGLHGVAFQKITRICHSHRRVKLTSRMIADMDATTQLKEPIHCYADLILTTDKEQTSVSK
jgi:trimethylamine:corrinoid methyltransferase-like protein